MSKVNHPAHYGGAANPYEAIKVIEAWNLNFHLGNTVKYISRAGKKGSKLEDLEKAAWYLAREIDRLRKDVSISGKASAEEPSSNSQLPSTKKRSRRYEPALLRRSTRSAKKSGSS